ncbi:MAG: hypothetical protein ACHQT5_00325 [Candidatus Saccharimonadales bacterium]|jgi:hypothetical protein
MALLIFGSVAAAERQNVSDWLALRSYQPSNTVVELATETTMNAYARKVFYVNHPNIDNKINFYQNCPNNGGEKTVVLGCYHNGQRGIFVLQVSDPRLSGIEQVTAAHETLHAIYDRLSSRDRNYVDGLLMDYYQHDLHDKRILDTIAAYKKSEPNDVVNEMHSVFGTEVTNLPTPLENYYKQYFTERQKIAAYASQYEAAFTSRQNQVAEDDTSLASMKAKITTDEASLQAQQKTIDSDKARLENLKDSSDYADYNNGVPSFNSEVDTYNTMVTVTRSLIAQYNQLVEARNAIAIEENQLVQDISSAPQQIPQ